MSWYGTVDRTGGGLGVVHPTSDGEAVVTANSTGKGNGTGNGMGNGKGAGKGTNKRKAADNPTATGKPKNSASTDRLGRYVLGRDVDVATYLFDDPITSAVTEGPVVDDNSVVTEGYMQRRRKYRDMCTEAGRRQFFTELNKKPKTEHAEAIEELCAEMDTHIKETKELYRLFLIFRSHFLLV